MRRFSIVLLLAAALWQPATAFCQALNVGIPYQPAHVYDPSKPFLSLTPGLTQTGNVLEFYNQTPLVKPAVTTFTNGGTGAASNYYARAVWIDFAGRMSVPGNEASYLGHGNQAVIHPPTTATGAAGWLPFVSSTAGTETLQRVSGNCTTVTVWGITACAPSDAWTTPASGLSTDLQKVPAYNSAYVRACYYTAAGANTCGAVGAGTVTTFSAGNLSPLFTTSVASATTTPALSFSLTNAAAGTVFGNVTSSAGAPGYTPNPFLGLDNSVAGSLSIANGSAAAHTIWGSAATTTNSILGFTVAPSNGDLVGCTVSGTTCTLTDAGAPPSAASKVRTCNIDNDTQSATPLVAAQFSGHCIIGVTGTIIEVDIYAGTQILTSTPTAPTFTGTGSVQIGDSTASGPSTNTGMLSAQVPTVAGYACVLPTAGAATCPIMGITQAATINISTTAVTKGDMLFISAATPDTAQTWYTMAIHYRVN